LCLTLFVSIFSVAQTLQQASDVDKRAEAILAQMTLEEKVDMLGGTDGFFIRGFDRLHIPRLKMADGPLGVRNFGPSTVYAAGISLAATFDPDLARRVGVQIGRDARAKGAHFLLGPGLNIYRAPMNGRNFEYFGEDPYLAARIATGYITGVQSQGVIATAKHYMGNNSEYDRHKTNSEIDARTMHEIYLPTFEAAVKEAHVGAIMDSYNLINGEHATQSKLLNTDIAKRDWGFDGILMSDWDATYDGVAAANSGLDLEMPDAKAMKPSVLLPAIREGKVSQGTIDDKVRRILRTAIRFGFFDREQMDISIPRFNQEGRQAALDGARAGIVLLKNTGNLLPLNKSTTRTIAVIGPNAYPAKPAGGGSARVEAFTDTSFLQGVSDGLGTAGRVLYETGVPSDGDIAEQSSFVTAAANGEPGLHAQHFNNGDFTGPPLYEKNERPIMKRQPATYPGARTTRWTGYFIPKISGTYRWYTKASGRDSYTLWINGEKALEQPRSEGQVPKSSDMQMEAGKAYEVRFDYRGEPSWLGSGVLLGVLPRDKWVNSNAVAMAKAADIAIVFVGYDENSESEAADRDFKLPPNQNELVQAIAAANKNTVVVLTAGGNVDMTQWIDAVPGLFHTWYPGQEGGRALADLLFGSVNPSGKLPVTFERHWKDNPASGSYYPNDPASGPTAVKYNEGVFVGYRGYEKNGTRPLFPFGYGLSYTTFKFSNLKTTPGAPRLGQAVTVSFDVTNTGKTAGAEVAQLYLGNPGASVPRPAKELKGFAKVNLNPGETKHVSLQLTPREMSFFDVGSNNWKQEPGRFEVKVGHSSADIDLQSSYTVQP
jgi:beta-glucosidase